MNAMNETSNPSSSADVAFILVNYGSEDHTRRCAASIVEKTRGVRFEILVIDNHSGFDAGRFKQSYPQARVFLSERNLGLGVANNIAAAHASSRHLFFLNNDCELLNDAATILFQWMESHPNTGVCGAQLVEPDGRENISFDYFPTLAMRFLGAGLLRVLGFGRFPRKDGTVKSPTAVDVVSGAALFIRTEIFKRLDGFDPQFFLYCEEEDLAMRSWRAGHSVYFVPDAKIRHVGGGSSQETAALRREFYISFFRFYNKHYGAFRTALMTLFTAGQIFIRFMFRPEKSVWRGILHWFGRGMPESESLRYAPGNIDAPPRRQDPVTWVREV
jgi:GT2 family glycosyltransferase